MGPKSGLWRFFVLLTLYHAIYCFEAFVNQPKHATFALNLTTFSTFPVEFVLKLGFLLLKRERNIIIQIYIHIIITTNYNKAYAQAISFVFNKDNIIVFCHMNSDYGKSEKWKNWITK